MANNYSTDLETSSTQYWSNAASTTLALKSNITIESWFKFETLPSSGNTMWLVEKKSEAVSDDFAIYALYIVNSAGTYSFAMRTTNGSDNSNQDDSVTFSPTTGTWVHLAVTRSSTGTIKFYVNGAQQGADQTGYNGVLAGQTNKPFYIGHYRAAEHRGFDGLINDFRLWDVVRSTTEINDNKSNCSLSNSATNLISRWFNENNNGNDQTASANNLTNNNTCTFSSDVAYSCAVGPATLSSMNSVTKATMSSVNSAAIATITSINSVA